MFTEDLQQAQEEEMKLAERLMLTGKYDGYVLGDGADWDIKLNNETPAGTQEVTIELKHDKYPNDSVAVELFCLRRLKFTGILATKADWFVILKHNTYYWMKPTQIKRAISTGVFTVTSGGDDKQSVMALIPIEYLENIATVDNSEKDTKNCV